MVSAKLQRVGSFHLPANFIVGPLGRFAHEYTSPHEFVPIDIHRVCRAHYFLPLVLVLPITVNFLTSFASTRTTKTFDLF